MVLTRAEEQDAKDELLDLYQRYVDGEVDLYAISVRVGLQTRHRLQQLIDAGPDTSD
ncbi:hypothetical protein [Hymenobacter sp. UYCo722]|uniref:hypothetical protein n=1 Tax=Hymenobacter sp. UYCo722 TaxID=3156335 RepID=UPI0033997B2B